MCWSWQNRWRRSVRAWQRLSIALCMAIALPATSCRSIKENTTTSMLDKLAYKREVNVSLETIPASLATLAIPLDSLRRLPGGATYANRQGRATATVGMRGDTVVVTAHCDSLQAVVAALREELDSVQRLEAAKTVDKRPSGRMECFMLGLVTGLSMVLIIKLTRYINERKR